MRATWKHGGHFIGSGSLRSSHHRPSVGGRLKSAAFGPEGTVVVLGPRAHGRAAWLQGTSPTC